MPLLTVHLTGLDRLQVRLATLRAALGPALATGLEAAVGAVRDDLVALAPRGGASGGGGGTPPAGDAPGPLVESFVVTVEELGPARARATLTTTQPTKLRWIREGTGLYGPRGTRITPTQARALMWEGAAHPYRSVRGMPPNDFVTPVLAGAQDAIRPVLQAVVGDVIAGSGS